MFLTPDIQLLPEGAVFLTSSSTLILSDVHLGKSATFRARGLPVPEGDTPRDLARIRDLVNVHHAAHLVIAGDLFHAPSGVTPEIAATLESFLRDAGVPFSLVRGNHDAKLKNLPAGITAADHLDFGTVRIVHDPAHASPGRFNITGHWHPVVRIPDGRRTSLRLPCFLLRGGTLVMPSFGSFTGGAIVDPEEGDRFFVDLKGKVIEVPAALV